MKTRYATIGWFNVVALVAGIACTAATVAAQDAPPELPAFELKATDIQSRQIAVPHAERVSS